MTPDKGPRTEVVTDLGAARSLRADWSALLSRSAHSEVTQTPEWLLTWWGVFGGLGGRALRLCCFFEGDRLVGLAPLCRRRHWHRPGIPLRRLEFLGSGEPEPDSICTPYLNVLAERGAEERVARRLAAAVAGGGLGTWDEVVLPMMAGDGPMPGLLAAALAALGFEATVTTTTASPYVPLPPTWEGYLASLSSGHRHHVRRCLGALEQWAGGTARVERVSGPADLERGKRVLIDLHHARWRGSGQGVFRSPLFLRFHDEVMGWLLEWGALELDWLTVRGEPVAALYGVVWKGKVCCYQTGRRTGLPPGVSPGVVLLLHSLRAAIAQGRTEFDLLPGVALYKTQLAPALRPVVQVRASRRSLAELARRLVGLVAGGVRPLRRAWRRRIPPAPQPGGPDSAPA